MGLLGWKLVHILCVLAFLGNITTGLFWAARAYNTHDASRIVTTFRDIELSDRWFTLPGVIGIVISGVAMALNRGFPILGTGWIVWPIVLFTLSGLVFAFAVAPLQRRLARQGGGSPSLEACETLYKRWLLWGVVSVLTPFLALGIMVLKPSLPGI